MSKNPFRFTWSVSLRNIKTVKGLNPGVSLLKQKVNLIFKNKNQR